MKDDVHIRSFRCGILLDFFPIRAISDDMKMDIRVFTAKNLSGIH